MHRRTFLKSGVGSLAFLLAQPRSLFAQSEAAEAEQDLLRTAAARIERIRKGPAVLKFSLADGSPARNVEIRMEQVRHDFLFGCNFFRFGRTGEPELEDLYRERFVALMNYATLGFYWSSYEPTQGRARYDYADSVLEWTKARQIICKGHPLVWDHPAGSPKWLPDKDAELEKLSLGRVREIITRFKGRIDIWDVVNEATHLPEKVNKTRMAEWAHGLGPVSYVKMHLEAARAAGPDAALLVNDYRLEPAYFRILEEIRSANPRLFDIVGIQSHMHGSLWGADRIWRLCEMYARLGLPLHFTETTLVSGPRRGPGENWGETTPALEERQASDAEKFYTLLFSHPAVEALTWWDFSDRGAWQGAAAGFLRNDMSPKPVYDRLMGLVKGHWWTRTSGNTGQQGQFEAAAIYGLHQVVAKLPNGREVTQTIHVTRGGPTTFEITL